MDKITIEEVMDKLYMFQSRFEEIDEFGWWDLERISVNAGTQFTSTEFKKPNLKSSFDVSGTKTTGNAWIG